MRDAVGSNALGVFVCLVCAVTLRDAVALLGRFLPWTWRVARPDAAMQPAILLVRCVDLQHKGVLMKRQRRRSKKPYGYLLGIACIFLKTAPPKTK
jgi:hypothetical protein